MRTAWVSPALLRYSTQLGSLWPRIRPAWVGMAPAMLRTSQLLKYGRASSRSGVSGAGWVWIKSA